MTDQPHQRGSKADYARARGVTKPYLSKPDIKELLEKAMVYDEDAGKLLLDFALADKLLKDKSDPTRNSKIKKNAGTPTTKSAETPPADTADPVSPADDDEKPKSHTVHDIKTKRDNLKLQQEIIDFEARLGNILSKADVEDALASVGKILRDKLQSRNILIAQDLQNTTDVLVIRSKLEESDRRILMELSHDLHERLSIDMPATPKPD